MRHVLLTTATVLFLAEGGAWQAGLSAQETRSATTVPSDIGGVRKLVLPDLDPDLPSAKGVETVKVMCGMCHTPHYILIQPPLSREVWTAEVTKMQKTYSGPIPPESVPAIMEYLMAVRGIGK